MPKSNLTARMLSVANETADIKNSRPVRSDPGRSVLVSGIKSREKGRIASE